MKPTPTRKTALPPELVDFAAQTEGDYESRFLRITEYAFREYGLFVNSQQLRQLCGGGSNDVAQRVVNRFRMDLHHQLTQRLSAAALAEWIEQGLPADMRSLSAHERLVARVFAEHVAKLTMRH